MHLPRMTMRRWMVAVAIVAFVIAGTIEVPRLWNVRRNYLALAEFKFRDLRAYHERSCG